MRFVVKYIYSEGEYLITDVTMKTKKSGSTKSRHLTIEEIKSEYKGIKSINCVIDDEPIIDDELMEVAKFISKRYNCC